MTQITYESESAVLSFDYSDVMDNLTKQIKEHNVAEDSSLLNWLEEHSANGPQDIKINLEDETEGAEYLNRIVWVIKDLLSNRKGNVFCKRCSGNILASGIKKDQTTPFDAHKGVDKKTIKKIKKEFGLKGRINLPAMGGTTFFCDKGHEIFATRDWII